MPVTNMSTTHMHTLMASQTFLIQIPSLISALSVLLPSYANSPVVMFHPVKLLLPGKALALILPSLAKPPIIPSAKILTPDLMVKLATFS